MSMASLYKSIKTDLHEKYSKGLYLISKASINW